KVSIGIREGRITGIGRAGNPDTLDGVDVVVGTGTTMIPGEGLIATAGAVDTHVHLLSPRIMEASLASGVTTIIGQEIGPSWGVGVNSPWALRHAFNAFDAWPVNIGFLARGSSSGEAPLVEALAEGGASGFKVHEDMGAHTRALDTALRVAEEYDVQVALHSDGLNECLSVEDTLSVLDGRTIHAFHIEGCGGGHVPNVLKMAGVPNVIGSSTNPTLPFGRDAVAEHYGMIVSVHDLKTDLPGDAAMARDRIRAGTMGAEDVLHDLGAIGITSSDAQGMGRAGETVRRTFAMAGKMKAELGPMDGDGAHDDNARVLRYMAKLTINPAIAHGLAHEIGSIEVGKMADIVLWRPQYFGAKPQMVIKNGFPAWGVTGDPNAATDTCEPLVLGPLFGAHGATPADISVAFVSQAAAALGNDQMPTRRRRVGVRGTRGIGPKDLLLNTRLGDVRVDARDGLVTLDGEPLRSEPAHEVSLSRLYFL
ncbi:urease subunit alpha, partial [Streptomyces sp. NPDC000410]|uniref:urease subunit alpha n=1 Tax=Streptomyces sp. NPDC000410 TaxID=3154254 RepID=UPI0033206360